MVFLNIQGFPGLDIPVEIPPDSFSRGSWETWIDCWIGGIETG